MADHPLETMLVSWRDSAAASSDSAGAVELLELAEKSIRLAEDMDWVTFLDDTAHPDYLSSLPDRGTRLRWSEVALEAIRKSNYTIETLLERRTEERPDHPYFRERVEGEEVTWTLSMVRRRARAIAAALIADTPGEAHVALFLENSVDGACADLACLAYGLLNSPLNVHFDNETVEWIVTRLGITVGIADTEERVQRLLDVREKTGLPLRVIATRPSRATDSGQAELLAEIISHRTAEEIGAILEGAPRKGLDDICTVMFTSGSTGQPKGVCFTVGNLITKRFARAAALPDVGRDEVLYCYLPLFHTFGRFLELLGMLFWRGTYVFAGNPSTESFFAGIARVQPTGLISIPLRWTQIREKVLERLELSTAPEQQVRKLREIVGDRLRWGLSAAGYLDPKTFRFFHQSGVELGSGFGMTEATGGITMSPPGDYLEDTVGVALPGIRITFSDEGEMRIGGAYVARYLDPDGKGLDLLPWDGEDDGVGWLATGDIFQELDRGHLMIVDRVKDIYKNVRGQTIAPRKVEKKFTGVPGIKRVFLVGDHRNDNVLLIVPDLEDPVLKSSPSLENRNHYFRRIIATANSDLAPYERVVNFALLERDFDIEQEELTPKGSYRRKTIQKHFADTIESLYQKDHLEFVLNGLKLNVPRWLLRELGVLEQDITTEPQALVDSARNVKLAILPAGKNRWRIGSLDYELDRPSIDLGLLSRQPLLWAGNTEAIAFLPCREGWDTRIKGVGLHLFLPDTTPLFRPLDPAGVTDNRLLEVNRLLQQALFGSEDDAIAAVTDLGDELATADSRHADLIRRRLASLATHESEQVRCLAYRVILLDEPVPDYGIDFPSFLQSGKRFLNEESIQAIAAASFEQYRLDALRQRLQRYRDQLEWPADEVIRDQFVQLFHLLSDFVRYHTEFYKPVRAELAAWILHRADPDLAAVAEKVLYALVDWYESRLAEISTRLNPLELEQRVVFDEEMDEETRDRMRTLLLDSTFLRQSVILAFDDESFDLDQLPDGGVWVSQIVARSRYSNFRVSVNTITGRHYDLLVVLRDDLNTQWVLDTNHWTMVIAGQPTGNRSMPRFGCSRPELGAFSLEYVSDLTLWDKIREASAQTPGGESSGTVNWRKYFIRAIAAFLEAWQESGRSIVPGRIDPANVVIPEPDFREGALILSLSGWRPYRAPIDLFRPFHATFYRRVIAQFPVVGQELNPEWMFDACVEALGEEEARSLLLELRRNLTSANGHPFDKAFLASLDEAIQLIGTREYIPIAVQNAIDRYQAWNAVETDPTPAARLDLIDGLLSMYRLGRYGEVGRYILYRNTWFVDARHAVRTLFDRLVHLLYFHPERPATQRVELPELQALLDDPQDRLAFAHLVFPRSRKAREMQIRAIGEAENKLILVITRLDDSHDDHYEVREPETPEEVGRLYRLFYQENVMKVPHEQDHYLLIVDATDRIVGGLTYHHNGRNATLDAMAITTPLHHRGLASGLIEDIAGRLASAGVRALKTTFMMREFFEPRGFQIDRRYGGLVRFLATDTVGPLDRHYPHSDI